MKKIAIFLILCFIIFSTIPASAQIINFTDTANYWSGWGNGSSDDHLDSIGVPNFTGGQAVVNHGLLTSLTFNRGSGFSSALSAGDLFIDLGGNSNWDYVVDLTNWGIAGPGNTDPGAGNYGLYSVNLALNSSTGYILSGTDNNSGNAGGWHGYYIRDGHPVAADLSGQSIGQVGFTGWNSSTSYTFTLPNGGLYLGDSGNFSIGWMPNCANDVIYETLQYSATPEPATMSLLGLGLLGIFGLRKRRSK